MLKTTPIKHWYSYVSILVLFVLLTSGSYILKAQSSSTATAKTHYEGIYVVITSHTDKGMLETIKNKLKKWDIQFEVKNASFSNGLLTGVMVEVDIPGVYKRSIIAGDWKHPLSEPVVFYHETSKGARLSNGIPEELSAKGKQVVTNNLKGVLIMYDADNAEFSGTGHTNWK